MDAVLTFDLKGRFQYINPATEQIMGYTSDELIGKPFLSHIVPERQAYTIARFSKVMEGKAVQYETAMYTKSKDIVELHVTIIPIMVNGTVAGIHCIGKDITEKKHFEEKLNEMAFHDYLTKLPNQHYFHQYLQKLIDSSKRENAAFALFFLDLDRFKSVNDAFGHDFGDLLLVETANRLAMHLPVSARVFRYGGDELIIILEGAGEEEAGQAVQQVLMYSKSRLC
nr:sensor domain-containing diguanylate cyclase [Domibacillus antri]